MATGFESMEIDPKTGLPKVKSPTPAPSGAQNPYLNETTQGILPYTGGNGTQGGQSQQPDPYKPQGGSTPQTLDQGNAAVMSAAQNSALNQQTNPLQQASQWMVAQQMKNPGFGYDGAAQKANQLSNFDYSRANAAKTFKENNGDLGGSGEIQDNLLRTLLAGNVDRANLENDLDLQAVDRSKQDWADAIAAGQGQVKQDTDVNTQAINNLLGVRGAYEGERAQTAGFAYDEKKTATQNAQQLLLQANDQAGARELAELNGKIQSGQILSAQAFQGSQAALDRALKTAMQKNDIDATTALTNLKAKLDFQADEADRAFVAKMKTVDADIAEAAAQGDFGRQMQLLSFKNENELRILEDQQGHEVAMANLDAKLKTALQNNDAANTMSLTKLKIAADATEHAKDLAMQQAGLDLEKAGVDMKKAEQAYAVLQAEVDAGRADPSSLTAFVQGLLQTSGVTITPPDENATQKAADKQYTDMLYQFSKTHPELTDRYYVGANGQKVLASIPGAEELATAGYTLEYQLKPEGVQAFNQFFNSATYGELTPEDRAARSNAGVLSNQELPTAQVGDVFNLTAGATDKNGVAIPPGRYTIVEGSYQGGNSVIGKTTVKTLVAVDASGRQYVLRDTDKSKDYGLLFSALDPGGFFKSDTTGK